ncbi:MAG TPA: hypothetical protein VGK81_03675, partial [Anaerolineae bacterium]
MFDLDDSLTAVMDRVDELRANQTEPLGAPANPAHAQHLKNELARLLRQIEEYGPTQGLREVARL